MHTHTHTHTHKTNWSAKTKLARLLHTVPTHGNHSLYKHKSYTDQMVTLQGVRLRYLAQMHTHTCYILGTWNVLQSRICYLVQVHSQIHTHIHTHAKRQIGKVAAYSTYTKRQDIPIIGNYKMLPKDIFLHNWQAKCTYASTIQKQVIHGNHSLYKHRSYTDQIVTLQGVRLRYLAQMHTHTCYILGTWNALQSRICYLLQVHNQMCAHAHTHTHTHTYTQDKLERKN